MKLVNDERERVDIKGESLGRKKMGKRYWISIGKKIVIFVVALILLRGLLLLTIKEGESRIMIQIIETPIHFALAPGRQIEENPFGVFIWVVFTIWIIRKTKKNKQSKPVQSLNSEKSDKERIEEEDEPLETEEVKKDLPSANSEIKEKEAQPKENKKHEVIYQKEKAKWGWGWIVVCGLFFYGWLSYQPDLGYEITNGLLMGLNLLVLIVLPVFYFRLRTRLIKKKKYSQIWHSSFIAGFVSYIVTLLIVSIAVFGIFILERKKDNSFLKTYFSEYKDRVLVFEKEENEIWERFVLEPSSELEIETNITLMKQILPLFEKKSNLAQEMILGLERIVQKRNNPELSSHYNRLKEIALIDFSTSTNAIQNLIEYYETGSDEKYNQYVDLMTKVDEIQKEMIRLYEYLASHL